MLPLPSFLSLVLLSFTLVGGPAFSLLLGVVLFRPSSLVGGAFSPSSSELVLPWGLNRLIYRFVPFFLFF